MMAHAIQAFVSYHSELSPIRKQTCLRESGPRGFQLDSSSLRSYECPSMFEACTYNGRQHELLYRVIHHYLEWTSPVRSGAVSRLHIFISYADLCSDDEVESN